MSYLCLALLCPALLFAGYVIAHVRPIDITPRAKPVPRVRQPDFLDSVIEDDAPEEIKASAAFIRDYAARSRR